MTRDILSYTDVRNEIVNEDGNRIYCEVAPRLRHDPDEGDQLSYALKTHVDDRDAVERALEKTSKLERVEPWDEMGHDAERVKTVLELTGDER